MVSEYLGCHIFNLLGVKAQETLLGIYKALKVSIEERLGLEPAEDMKQLQP